MATTVEEFEELVYAYARTHGQPFILWQDRAKLRGYISRQLSLFVEETKVLYVDNVTMDTTASDDGTYDLRDTTVFSHAILEPEVVLLEDAALVDLEGFPGLISVAQANDLPYDYRTVTRAQPQHACLFPPQTLRLIPRPDAAYDVTISGWIQHFDLTGSNVKDTTNMELGDGTIDAAAMYIAGEMIQVGGEGPSLQAGMALAQRGLAKANKAAGRAASFLQGPQIRGRRLRHTHSLD